jgi:hypothetical protein
MIKLSEQAQAFIDMAETVLCDICVHKILYSSPEKCKAFPDGIPGKIYSGGFRHLEPYPGDHGIMFEEIGLSEDLKKDEAFEAKR